MPTSKIVCDVDSLPRIARRRYYMALAVLLALSAVWIKGVLELPSASSLSKTRKLAGFMLCLLGCYTHFSLRARHMYYVKSARLGCKPAPRYPDDPLGIGFLLATAKDVKEHVLLQQRQELLNSLGHTFISKQFPDPYDAITTDDVENVKAVLSAKFEDWDLPSIRIKSFLPVLGKHSIFTTNGAEWQHSRAILRPAFVRDQISDLQCFDRHVRRLVELIPKDGTTFDLQAMFSMLTTDIISDFMFGQSTDLQANAPEESHRFGRYFDASMQKIAYRARLGWITVLRSDPELDKYSSFMKEFVARFVKNVRQNAKTAERSPNERKYVFLDELLKSGESDEVIRDHLISIFTAGRDTTTSVLSYLFFELSRRPDVVATIRTEIKELGHDDPSWEDLRNMEYLNWVLKEALRLNPPVASNQRQAIRDTILPRGGGPDGKSPVFVEAGTNLRYIPWVFHRRKDLFGEDADEFKPARWEKLRVTYEYVPFNAGPRICIGQQFALTQMALITFRLLQAFSAIERRDDRPPIQKLGINLSMLHGCLVSMNPAQGQ
ncbi:cytochrome P450 [Xylariaceae sp. FL0594]|nr:cytochrome P450 [Xylariaceae sp. FL0594]